MVAGHIEHPGSAGAFLARFRNAVSPGFDPDQHLVRIGLANQTTMLSSESLAIAERLRQAMERRYGEPELAARFRSFDTICSATQDRQDAVRRLMADPPDVMIIVGGFNSSNTNHLAEICAGLAPTFHVESAEALLDVGRIHHKPVGAEGPVVAEGWLPKGHAIIGLTAGASTPDREIGRLIIRLLELRGLRDDAA